MYHTDNTSTHNAIVLVWCRPTLPGAEMCTWVRTPTTQLWFVLPPHSSKLAKLMGCCCCARGGCSGRQNSSVGLAVYAATHFSNSAPMLLRANAATLHNGYAHSHTHFAATVTIRLISTVQPEQSGTAARFCVWLNQLADPHCCRHLLQLVQLHPHQAGPWRAWECTI